MPIRTHAAILGMACLGLLGCSEAQAKGPQRSEAPSTLEQPEPPKKVRRTSARRPKPTPKPSTVAVVQPAVSPPAAVPGHCDVGNSKQQVACLAKTVGDLEETVTALKATIDLMQKSKADKEEVGALKHSFVPRNANLKITTKAQDSCIGVSQLQNLPGFHPLVSVPCNPQAPQQRWQIEVQP